MHAYLSRLALVAVLTVALMTGAQGAGERGKAGHDGEMDHVVLRPDELKWGPAPPSLPEGAMVAVLAGNPGKSAPFVIRAKLPAGYKVMPHFHPTDENVTVIKGTFAIGKGEKFSEKATEKMPVGSYMRMPKGMRHFAWAKEETIIQIHGMGPFEITYVNPADDPRKK